MGYLHIGERLAPIEFDDRLLAHLKVVIFWKFRRHESFAFSWGHGAQTATGRSSVWLHEGVLLMFTFHGGRPPTLNREWVELLLASANTPAGLQIVKEPPA